MSESSPDLPVESRPLPIAPPDSSGIPLWVTLVTGVVCLGIGLSVSFVLTRKKASPPVVVVSSAPSAEKKEPALTPLQLAEKGSPEAVDKLEKIAPSERSIEQALALSQGRAAEKHLALAHLRGTISKSGGLPDAESTKRLVVLAKDPDTAREVIGLFATLPGPLGPDLLNEFASDKKIPPELAKLAEELLLNKEVRPKASPALALVLDLRDASTCEARQTLLEKAIDVGDRRVVPLAVTFIKKTGCGDTKRDDCNPCLHVDNSKMLGKAITAARKRKSPSY